jgi:DNA-binding XRE family transcriptional regulator
MKSSSTKYTIKKKIVVEEDVTYKKFVGWKIEQLRKNKSLTQEELSDKLGLSRVSIVNIEKGRQDLSLRNLQNICELFNIKSSDILPF